MKVLMIVLGLVVSFQASAEIVEIENFEGKKTRLSGEDLATALSALHHPPARMARVEGGNSDGTINLINPEASYRGDFYPVKGTTESANEICKKFKFEGASDFQEAGGFLCGASIGFDQQGHLNYDSHYCHGTITVLSCITI